MVLEKHLHGGPFCIQACRDAQIYGIYEVPLLLPESLGHLVEPIMEDLLATHAVYTKKRHSRLTVLLKEIHVNPDNFEAQAEIAKIKEELELEALENEVETK